jgi:hypothetical protein
MRTPSEILHPQRQYPPPSLSRNLERSVLIVRRNGIGNSPPPSQTIAVAKTKAVPNPRPIVRAQSYPGSADGGPAVGAMDMGIAARLVMYGEQLTAMGSFPCVPHPHVLLTVY